MKKGCRNAGIVIIGFVNCLLLGTCMCVASSLGEEIPPEILLLLVSIFQIALVIGGILLVVGLLLTMVRGIVDSRKEARELAKIIPNRPIAFGWKTEWMTVPERPLEEIASLLGLINLRPCTWKERIMENGGGDLFISPPVKGWNFIIGGIFEIKEEGKFGESAGPALSKLSERFGEVYFFVTHRVTDFHVWAKAVDGKLVRGYGFLGEQGKTLWDDGDDSTEKELGWVLFDTEKGRDGEGAVYPQEDNVFEIARKWCISPTDLAPESAPPADGLCGDFPDKKPARISRKKTTKNN